MHIFKRTTAAVLAAIAVGHAQADTTIFSEGFEDVSGLAAKGWSFLNVGQNPSGDGWVQGSSSDMTAEDGSINSFVTAGYFSTMASTPEGGEYISALLLTPEIQLTGQDMLTFALQGPGGDRQDHVRVFVLGQSTQKIFEFTAPPPIWLTFNVPLPEDTTSVRIAFEYYGPNATAGYVGLDSVSVTSAVPEPSSSLLLGLGLGGVALWRRRGAAGRA